MTKKEELIMQAESLGMQDADTKTIKQLEKFIEDRKAEFDDTDKLKATLINKAKKLGIKLTGEETIQQLEKLISDKENPAPAETKKKAKEKALAGTKEVHIESQEQLDQFAKERRMVGYIPQRKIAIVRV